MYGCGRGVKNEAGKSGKVAPTITRALHAVPVSVNMTLEIQHSV